MSTPTPLAVVQETYAAFGAGDLPKILSLLAPDCEWEFVGPSAIPYCGKRTSQDSIQAFFGQVAESDDLHAFEPRELLPSGDHVTVLGWESITPKPRGKTFETEWIHVFTVKNGKITRFKGLYDSATSLAARA